jgi:hypothetical protein
VWNIIRRGHPFLDTIVLNKEETTQLGTYLLKAASEMKEVGGEEHVLSTPTNPNRLVKYGTGPQAQSELDTDKQIDMLEIAHNASSHNKDVILQSDNCGCFSCLCHFKPSDIKEWIDGGQTAVCPVCGVDAVIGSAYGHDLNDELLLNMKIKWFGKAR